MALDSAQCNCFVQIRLQIPQPCRPQAVLIGALSAPVALPLLPLLIPDAPMTAELQRARAVPPPPPDTDTSLILAIVIADNGPSIPGVGAPPESH